MKLEEKMRDIEGQLDALASMYGEYAVRSAVKRWARRVNVARYLARAAKERKLRSVWRPALRAALATRKR
jgi:hypothetical protein